MNILLRDDVPAAPEAVQPFAGKMLTLPCTDTVALSFSFVWIF